MTLRSTSTLLGLACLAPLAPCQAQTPNLLEDINTVAKPNPASNAQQFVRAGAFVYFTAQVAPKDVELWRTDGTTSGTVSIKNVNPGAATPPASLTPLGNRLLFVVPPSSSSSAALWITDGTTAGTVPVPFAATIGPGVGGYNIVTLGNLAFFNALGVEGSELWMTDGTPAGTTLVYDVNPGPAWSFATVLGAHQGWVYFAATEPSTGMELWRTNGSVTSMVADLLPGGVSSFPSGKFAAFGNDIYFFALSYQFQLTLYRSDGTAGGTMPVIDASTGALVATSAGAFFNRGGELWRTDGTSTLQLTYSSGNRTPSVLTAFGNLLLFSDDDFATGEELWRSDGTVVGTFRIVDLRPGTIGSTPLEITPLGNRAYFSAWGANGRQVAVTDGTAAGTAFVTTQTWVGSPLVLNLAADPSGRLLFNVDDGVVGSEPWVTDGTLAGTQLLLDIYPTPPGTRSSNPAGATDFAGVALFSADDGVNGADPWRSDGTAAGTSLLSNLGTGGFGFLSQSVVAGDRAYLIHSAGITVTDGTAAGTASLPILSVGSTAALGGTLFFARSTVLSAGALWKTDGTAAGTVQVKDVRPGGIGSLPTHLAAVNGRVFFAADDGVNGRELWVSDGTTAGTVMVTDLVPGPQGSYPTHMLRFRGALFFIAADPASELRLYTSDGTAAGTRLVAPGSAGAVLGLMAVAGSQLFFVANELLTGNELWVTDGTAAGTRLVKDIEPGSLNSLSTVNALTVLGDRMVFQADTSVFGSEPWVSDGTATGTLLLADLVPGAADSFAHSFVATGSRSVYFSAANNLYVTDGTTAGTRVVQAGAPGAAAVPLALSAGHLLFAYDDGLLGMEPWRLDPGASSKSVGEGVGDGLRVPTLTTNDPVLGTTFTLSGDEAVPGTFGFVLVSVGFSRPVAFGADAFLVIDPSSFGVLASFALTQPSWGLPVPLPSDPALAGIPLALQAAFAPSTASRGFDLTAGVHARIGM